MDFQFISNTSRLLVVETPIGFSGNLLLFLILIPIAVAVGTGAYFGTSRHGVSTQKAALLGVGFFCLLVLPLVISCMTTHKMTLSRDDNSAVLLTKFAGFTVNTRSYPLTEVQDCVLEYNRGVPRLSLVMANGMNVTPLSSGFDPAIGINQVQQTIAHFVSTPGDH